MIIVRDTMPLIMLARKQGFTLLFLFSLAGHLQLSLALDDDGGLVIFSANEVCRFLCGETGNEGFYGEDPTHQALVDYWLGWEASELKVSENEYTIQKKCSGLVVKVPPRYVGRSPPRWPAKSFTFLAIFLKISASAVSVLSPLSLGVCIYLYM